MIATTKYPTAFEDAIDATAFMATALLNRGELLLPERIREHIADGPVVVHLIRGEDDVDQCEATLTSESKLAGIDWPADVKPRTSLVVLCPRGGASHDIGVVLRELERPVSFVGDDADVNAALDEIEDEAPVMVHGRPDTWTAEEASIGERPAGPEPVSDDQLAAITGALTALADAAPVVESTLPGPAEYTTPTTLRVLERDEQPTETIAVAWPVDEPDPTEQTAIVPAVGTLPTRRGWFALAWFHVVAWFASLVNAVAAQVENAGQDVVDHAWVVAKVLVAAVAVLVLAGTGVLWLLLEVAR